MKSKNQTFLICYFLFSQIALGQKITSYLPYFKYETDTSNSIRNKELGIIPILYRTPETGFSTGLLFSTLFKMPGVKDSLTRTSNLVIPFVLTEYKQYYVATAYNLITKNERFYIRGMNVLQDFNEYFFGVGNESSQNGQQLISYKFLRVTSRVVYRITGRHFAGIQYNLYNTWHVKEEKGPPNLKAPKVLGGIGYIGSGIGLAYLYDSRDNIVFSTKGFFFDISSYSYHSSIGSDFNFANLQIDTRYFIKIRNGHILGLNTVLNLNDGDVPFMQLAHLGGQYIMRGYYYGRYRDKIYTAIQAEYRLKIWKWIGCTAFGSLGNISENFKSYDFNTIKYALGGGLRFLISKKENVNIRVDYGFYQYDSGIYLTVGEAF